MYVHDVMVRLLLYRVGTHSIGAETHAQSVEGHGGCIDNRDPSLRLVTPNEGLTREIVLSWGKIMRKG